MPASEADTVFDEGLVGADDSLIVSRSRTEDRVLVTLDLDFSNIRTYPPSQYAGIIVLRPKRQDKSMVLNLMKRIVLALANRTPGGELWIVEKDRIRFRVHTADLEPVLDFFETVGALVRRRALDLELAWGSFFYWVLRYAADASDQIQARRNVESDHTYYQDFEALAKRFTQVEIKKRHLKSPPSFSLDSLDGFLEEEMADSHRDRFCSTSIRYSANRRNANYPAPRVLPPGTDHKRAGNTRLRDRSAILLMRYGRQAQIVAHPGTLDPPALGPPRI